MRAARLLVLAVFCAMAMVWAPLLQSPGVPLSVLDFIGPLRADPLQVDAASGVPVAPDPAHPDPVRPDDGNHADAGHHVPLPAFVPRGGVLTNSNESAPEGEESPGNKRDAGCLIKRYDHGIGDDETSVGSRAQFLEGSSDLDQGRAYSGNRTGGAVQDARLAEIHRARKIFSARPRFRPHSKRAPSERIRAAACRAPCRCRSTVPPGRRCGYRAIATGVIRS